MPWSAVADAWIGWSVTSVTLCVCMYPRYKRKTTWAINTKLGTRILYCGRVTVATHSPTELWLGPFHGAIAVPSVTRCRCRRRCCCGHLCAGGDTWWMAMRRAAARSGEWAQHFSNASCYRKRPHTRQIPNRCSYLTDCNFLIRMLFADTYWWYLFICLYVCTMYFWLTFNISVFFNCGLRQFSSNEYYYSTTGTRHALTGFDPRGQRSRSRGYEVCCRCGVRLCMSKWLLGFLADWPVVIRGVDPLREGPRGTCPPIFMKGVVHGNVPPIF